MTNRRAIGRDRYRVAAGLYALGAPDGNAPVLVTANECGACAMNCPTKAISVTPGVGRAAAIMNGCLSGSKPSCGYSG